MRDHQTWGMDHSGNSHGGTWSLWWDWHFPYAYWALNTRYLPHPYICWIPPSQRASAPWPLISGCSNKFQTPRNGTSATEPTKKKRCGGTSPKLSHQVTRPYPLEAAQHPVVDASLGVALCWRSGCQRKQGVCWSQWLSEQCDIACDIIAFGLLNESQAWNTIDFIPRATVGFGSIALSGKVAGRASGRLAAISSGLQCIESRAWSFCEMWSAENVSNKPESNRPAFYSLLSNMFLMLDSD